MAVQTSYPGVYIEEFAPGAPIQGVGTSTAAFIGIAARGELDTPTKVTSWDQFRQTFGDQPLPGFFLWYAARGFFENGGQVCYVVRASNGDYQELMLTDRSAAGNDVIRVRARQPGIPATAIDVTVADHHELTTADTSLFQPQGTLAGAVANRTLSLGAGEGASFRPGDEVTVVAGGQRATVVRVTGDDLRVDRDIAGAAGATVQLADAAPGARTLRLSSTSPNVATALVPGALLTVNDGTNADSLTVESVQTEFLGGGAVTYRVTFREGLHIPLSMDPATPASVQSEEFDLTVAQGAGTTYAALAMDAAHPRFFLRVVNGDPNALVRLELVEPPPPVMPPENLPLAMAATALAGGAAEDLATMASQDYIDALDTLAPIDDVNLVAIPDASVATATVDPVAVQQALITHCELLADRFAVLDAQPALDLFGATSIEAQRTGLDSMRGYGALYFPWLRVRPAGRGIPMLVPPSGHVCGIIARSDLTRGVHKAPANEIVNGALGVEQSMSDVEQGQLNLQGINVVRVFGGGARPTLWGARTTSRDTSWQYVNIRRLFLFLEESIAEGIRWAVFEPNNLALWQKLRRTITDFLTRAWRDGALFGETPEDAFYVRIDEILNPFSEQALGRLHIEVGVRPSYPAEFIVVRIGIWAGGSEVTET